MLRKKMFKILAMVCMLALTITSLSIGAFALDDQPDYAPAKPKIESFKASSYNIQPGNTVKLSYKVLNATKVEIVGIEKEPECLPPVQGNVEVWPLVTTTYTLKAYGSTGVLTTASLTVKVAQVVQGPQIVSFTADKYEIEPGETVTLTWNITNAKDFKIIGIEKEIEGQSVEVWPMVTTTYILEVTGLDNSVVKRELTITVKAQGPKIKSFTASKYVVKKGEMITLTWATEGATTCKIETSTGQTLPNRPTNGSIAVTPNNNITYTLVAIDSNGREARQSVSISVTQTGVPN